MKSFVVLVFLANFLIACSDDTDSGSVSGFVEKPNDPFSCTTAQVKQQFLVVWKDGSISREYAIDKEDFKNNFMKHNEEYIQFAEHDYVIAFTPVGKGDGLNLTDYENWGTRNIKAESAWNKNARGEHVKVAIIDSGVDVFHEILQNQIALNEKEIPNNGIDDDNNGYIDDYYGYSYVTQDDNVANDSLHGTHVGGIIAAEHVDTQASYVQGVAPSAKLVPIKFIDADGFGHVSNAIDGIDYALSRGAKVINASWGGGCSETLKLKITQLKQHNVLFVAAAGNSGNNIDLKPEFPAAYATESVISVGAITEFNGMAFFSNYGDERVHLFAPGEKIYSTIPDNRFEVLDGTSMAAPFVSGAAAVVWGDRPNATPQQVKHAILSSVVVEKDNGGQPIYRNATRGRLNLQNALTVIRELIP